MKTSSPKWIANAEKLANDFAKKHKLVISLTDRQLSAAFEIGSLHALMRFYESQGYALSPKNLTIDNEYRYLTTPSGNPANFSYVEAIGRDGEFEIRQQVRVQSHINENIAFTPDIVVLVKGAAIEDSKSPEFANGKRPFYRVASASVVAAHECKSMNPFPELLVAFIGMLVAAHQWYPDGSDFYIQRRSTACLRRTRGMGGGRARMEFRVVAVMACDDEIIPSQARIELAADEGELTEIYETERHLLYVACTRARDNLHVSAVSPASEFLDDLL